jgi:hypothetical protein
MDRDRDHLRILYCNNTDTMFHSCMLFPTLHHTTPRLSSPLFAPTPRFSSNPNQSNPSHTHVPKQAKIEDAQKYASFSNFAPPPTDRQLYMVTSHSHLPTGRGVAS